MPPTLDLIAVAYAGLAAIVQPDAHVLLPLALALAAVGIVVGRDRWLALGVARLCRVTARRAGDSRNWAAIARI